MAKSRGRLTPDTLGPIELSSRAIDRAEGSAEEIDKDQTNIAPVGISVGITTCSFRALFHISADRCQPAPPNSRRTLPRSWFPRIQRAVRFYVIAVGTDTDRAPNRGLYRWLSARRTSPA